MSSPSERIGTNGIPKPKSLLSSFLFSRLSSPASDHHQQEQELEQERRNEPRSSAPLSLQSNLLPPCLLGTVRNDATGALRSRTVTDDATDEATLRQNASNSFTPPLLPRPRRSWNISRDDRTALSKVPDYYPPFDPNCTALVTDAPPSIVVVRISECLRKRSIAVEYDDESVTARCMTVDRCQFEIQLYRSSSSSCDDFDVAMNGDGTIPSCAIPSCDAVIVEVRRISSGSNIMSFHAACRKILLAAKGLDAGNDERRAHCRNGMEFRPRKRRNRPDPIGRSSNSNNNRTMKRPKFPAVDRASAGDELGSSWSSHSSLSSTRYYDSMDSFYETSSFRISESALEAALELLQKDRFECQQLGMERLVNLTTWDISGKETCRYVSRWLLLQEQSREEESGSSSATDTESLLTKYLMHPGAQQASELVGSSSNKNNITDRMVRSFLESSALSAIAPKSKSTRKQQHHERSQSFLFKKKKPLTPQRRSSSTDAMGSQYQLDPHHEHHSLSPDELRHAARLRSLALRVFCNTLDNLSKTKELYQILYPAANNSGRKKTENTNQAAVSRWVQPAFLLSLVQDLQGAGRPPSVSENGYKLASVHEAALAARCLRLLAGYGGDTEHEEETNTHEKEEQQQRQGDYCENDDGDGKGGSLEEVRDFLRSEPVLERLSYARSCGRATHAILEYEADRAYNRLTEDVRSC